MTTSVSDCDPNRDPNNGSSKPRYPPDLYHLSPTFGKWCPLRCSDLYTLKNEGVFVDSQPVHHHPTSHHPIRYIKLLGVVVSIDDFGRRRVYTIDDGSGACVECVALLPAPSPSLFLVPSTIDSSNPTSMNSANPTKNKESEPPSAANPSIPWSLISECSILRVLGMVDQFNGMLQLQVVKVTVVGSTDVERKWWDECADFKRDVLGKEWVLSQEEIRQHTKEKERLRRRGQKAGVEGKRGDEKTRKRTREKEGTVDAKRRHKKSSTEKDKNDTESARSLSTAPRPAVSSKFHPHLHPPRKPLTSTSNNPPYKPPRSTSNLASGPAIPGTSIKKRYQHLPITAAVIPEKDRDKYDTLGL
ncbi:ob-fold nucleic acid binding domain-containing protein [Rutstroemia sp. NJR-2017a BBW]|nr:ob-fold nucleic acid binding domain-containing protein [Rutstroemia sp. NJR-2017a BBW]